MTDARAVARGGVETRYPFRRRVRAARGLIPAFTRTFSHRSRRMSADTRVRTPAPSNRALIPPPPPPPGGAREALRVVEPVLQREPRRAVREPSERTRGRLRIVRLRRDEDEVRVFDPGDGRRDLRVSDEGRFPRDAEAGAADRVRVFLPAHERHAVPAGEEPAEEAAHRARTEDDDVHRGRKGCGTL